MLGGNTPGGTGGGNGEGILGGTGMLSGGIAFAEETSTIPDDTTKEGDIAAENTIACAWSAVIAKLCRVVALAADAVANP